MVAISRQYSFGADKAVQISQAVFFDKGTQQELRHKNCKISLLIWISDFDYKWLFWIQTLENFNIALSMHRQKIFFCGRPWPVAYINTIQNTHQIQVLTKPLYRAHAIFYSLPNNEWGTKYRGLTYSAK